MISSQLFVVSFSALMVSQALCEIYLSRLVPSDKSNLKLRFWSRAVADIALTMLVGLIGYAAVTALAKTKRSGLSWAVAIIPGVLIALGASVIQGTNTVLDKSSGGVGCYGLVMAAIRQSRNKK